MVNLRWSKRSAYKTLKPPAVRQGANIKGSNSQVNSFHLQALFHYTKIKLSVNGKGCGKKLAQKH